VLEPDASQKELGDDRSLASGTVSRRMAEPAAVGVVARERSHGPYRPLFRQQVCGLQLRSIGLVNLDGDAASRLGQVARFVGPEETSVRLLRSLPTTTG
jgi:hypothetical protein